MMVPIPAQRHVQGRPLVGDEAGEDTVQHGAVFPVDFIAMPTVDSIGSIGIQFGRVGGRILVGGSFPEFPNRIFPP